MSELIAAKEGKSVICFWTLKEVDDFVPFTVELYKEGFDGEWLNLPVKTPLEVVRASAENMRRNVLHERGATIRRVKGFKAFAILTQDVNIKGEEIEPSFQAPIVCRYRDKENDFVWYCRPELFPGHWPSVEDIKKRGEEIIEAERRRISASMMGVWLANRVYGLLGGVAIRDRGGVYFVSANNADKIYKLKNVFERTETGTLYTIPVFDLENEYADVLKAIVEGLTKEARELVEEIRETAESKEGKLSKRQVNTRKRRLEELEKRIRAYESVIGEAATKLANQLTQIQGAIVVDKLVEIPEDLFV